MFKPTRCRALRRCRYWPQAHRARRDARRPRSDQARASGFKPNSFAFLSLITSTAAAPSFNPEELPAVTVPFLRKAGCELRQRFQAGITARALVGSHQHRLTFPLGIGTATISSANFPESMAAIARWWLRRLKASCASRLIGCPFRPSFRQCFLPSPPSIRFRTAPASSGLGSASPGQYPRRSGCQRRKAFRLWERDTAPSTCSRLRPPGIPHPRLPGSPAPPG